MRRLRIVPLVGAVAWIGACGGTPTRESLGSSNQSLAVCPGSATVLGVDVSEYQGTVDWTSVRSSGRTFAIARVSDGTGNPDSRFATNWSGIKAAGMVRGAYQFFRASEDPTTQANLVVSAIGVLGDGDLSPIADVEVLDGESGATLVARLATWVSVIKSATGRAPILYSDPGFWDALPGTGEFVDNVLWVADWGPPCPTLPTPWSAWDLWQTSDTGTVAGITGAVDLDEFNGSLAALTALASGAAAAPGPSDAGVDPGGPTPAPPPPASTGCYSTTLAGNVAANTCVETDAAGDWVQCDSGTWADRWNDPTACAATYPWGNGGHSSGGGAGCYSTTLGAEEPDNACVQSAADHVWYQCDNGAWVDRWTDPTACNGTFPL